jgi:chemotaxis protein CheC
MAISDRKLYEDTLREICSFGAGHAAASLSKMLNQKIMISVPKVWIKMPEEPYFLPGQGKEAVIALNSHFGTEKEGVIFHLLSLADAKSLAGLLLGEELVGLSRMGKDALLELGNILSGSIVGSIANFIGEKIGLDQPKLTVDYPLAIVDYAVGEQMRSTHTALFASVQMSAEGKEISLMQLFFPFFDIVGYIWKKLSKSITEDTGEVFFV